LHAPEDHFKCLEKNFALEEVKNQENRLLAELTPILSLTILCFIENSAILTFYFAGVLSDFVMKHAPIKDGFLISLTGSAAGAVFSLVFIFLPNVLPLMDFAVAAVFFVWISLLHFRYKEGWLEAVFEAVLGCIIYVVILAFTSGFLILWISMG
jgi:hypothetical protein